MKTTQDKRHPRCFRCGERKEPAVKGSGWCADCWEIIKADIERPKPASSTLFDNTAKQLAAEARFHAEFGG